MGYLSGMSSCHTCRTLFSFHPEKVISVRVRRGPNGQHLPLDVNDDGTPGRQYTPEEFENAPKVLICPSCVENRINPGLREAGQPEWPVFDTTGYMEV